MLNKFSTKQRKNRLLAGMNPEQRIVRQHRMICIKDQTNKKLKRQLKEMEKLKEEHVTLADKYLSDRTEAERKVRTAQKERRIEKESGEELQKQYSKLFKENKALEEALKKAYEGGEGYVRREESQEQIQYLKQTAENLKQQFGRIWAIQQQLDKEQQESKRKDKEISRLKQLSEDHRRKVLIYAGKEGEAEKKIQSLEAVIVNKKATIQGLRD